MAVKGLTLDMPIGTIMSNSVSDPDPSCLIRRQHFHEVSNESTMSRDQEDENSSDFFIGDKIGVHP